jgi:dynein heavy chain, axonemal
MFGYRLRSNVADPEEVDIMIKKVYRLLNHILNVDYDIFVPNNKDNWEATLDYFYKCMESVENEARVVLDQCIDSLKSAELGLELVGYLNTIETRDKLLKHLLSKKESIMRKFVTEVGVVEHEFLVSKACLQRMSIPNVKLISSRYTISPTKEISKESAASKESE